MKRSPTTSPWFLLLVWAWAWIGMAQDTSALTYWRVSIKFIVGPKLTLPAYGPSSDPFQGAEETILSINQDLKDKGSDYRLRLVEVIALEGIEEYFTLEVTHQNTAHFDAYAKAEKDRFGWRDDALNIYINGTDTGEYTGYCSFPGWDRDVILVRQDASTDILFHEMGHFFNVYHTHEGSIGLDCEGEAITAGDGDFCDDTLADHPCFDRDQLAGGSYDDLSAAEQLDVDNTWMNLMSYHAAGTVITPDQWSRIDEATEGSRSHVVGPRHWFVDRNNVCKNPNGSRVCAFTGKSIIGLLQSGGGPFPTVAGGVEAAGSGDLVRIRSGTYEESLTLTKRLTFQAENGAVLIR